MTDIAVLKKLNGSSSQGGSNLKPGQVLTPSASKRK